MYNPVGRPDPDQILMKEGTARAPSRYPVDPDTSQLSPDERKVIDALADARWDFRTLDGLSREAGLAREKVREILDRHAGLVRESAVPDRRGRRLYTLRSRHVKGQEMLAILRTFIAKTVR